ncbi:MAG: hypothetical protein FWJ61_02440 [Limnochordales bacterium]
MTKAGAVRRMFPGGNTWRGFHSFYDQIIGPDARRVFILKGGPGAGKSTFMKWIADRLAAMGFDAEYHHCSADPASVDAVVFPSLRTALLDGTAPHVVDPPFPGLTGEIIDLGRFTDDAALRPHADDIRRLSEAGRQSFRRAYHYLAAAKAVRDAEKDIHGRAMDHAFVHRQARRLAAAVVQACEEEAPAAASGETEGAAGRRRRLFAGSITPLGPVHHLDTLAGGLPRVFVVRGRPGTGASTLLNKAADAVTDRGWDAELFFCPFDPDRLEHLVVPAAGVAVVTSRPPHEFKPAGAEIIDLDHGLSLPDPDARHAAAARRMFGNLFEHATAALAEARQHHLRLEALYRPAMDFGAVNELRGRVFEKILAHAPG